MGACQSPRFLAEPAAQTGLTVGQVAEGAGVTPDAIREAGMADTGEEIKILGAGKLRRRLTVEAHAASETARSAIEAKGGTLTILESKQKTSAGQRKRARQAAEQAEQAAQA